MGALENQEKTSQAWEEHDNAQAGPETGSKLLNPSIPLSFGFEMQFGKQRRLRGAVNADMDELLAELRRQSRCFTAFYK